MSDYVEYARDVASEMRRNGYPKLCVAQGDVDEQMIAAYEAELVVASDERPLQRFLEDHPGLLAQQLGALCRWVLPQVNLGGRFIPDFMVARMDSAGVHWTLVELESPTAQLFTRDGLPRRELRKGLSQIQDWRDWLSANQDFARKSRAEHGLGLVGVNHRASGLVIIGRRESRSSGDRERLDSLIFRERVLIRSYDWLLEEARSRIPFTVDLTKSRAVICEECELPGRSLG